MAATHCGPLKVVATHCTARLKITTLNWTLPANAPNAQYSYNGKELLQLLRSTVVSHEYSQRLCLPPELEDLIMKCLSDDLAALRCASLTCRSWLAAARPYIFRYPRVHNEKTMRLLLSALRSSPMISNCIRALRIGNPKASDPFIRNNSVTQFLSLLSDLQNPLKNLLSLDMFGVVESWDAKVVKKMSTGLSSVASLSLGRCGVSPDELCAVLCAFPNVRHVKLEYCATVFNGRLKHAALPTLHSPALTSLEVDDKNTLKDGMEALLDCLLGSPSRHTLRSVKLMIGEESVQSVGEFLWALGEHLENLELGFWLHIDTIVQLCSKAVRYVDLSHNTALQTLTLHDPSFPLTQTLLMQVAAPHLTMITLRWAPKAFLCASRALLVGVLNAEKFRKVKSVRCVYDGGFDEGMEPKMRRVFKELDEKGILSIAPKIIVGILVRLLTAVAN
ncbi:hypothetical protein EIP91_005324 [Steccherinum ochraceum]|uniref:F-box domain-containing protein n=1 Tax=Steccherinum ochraceum TaxID=92696 RepID=A0A4R0RA65_9APHY|nr:hypothetical protein EIP91_005324 [Steccherinum ochraceum]